jgi:hypothetical protein
MRKKFVVCGMRTISNPDSDPEPFPCPTQAGHLAFATFTNMLFEPVVKTPLQPTNA